MRIRESQWRLAAGIAAIALGAGCATPAWSYEFTVGPDWVVNLDNTVLYNVGIRATSIDPKEGNAPNYDESDYKFKAGDIVTDRISDLAALQAVYQNQLGFRFSASAWKDFAYNADDASNPGIYAPAGTGPGAQPAITYASIRSYSSGQYSDYTKFYHLQGAELLDAFAFKNTQIGSVPVYLKAGRLTQQWGNGLFFSFQSISYSQNPIDFIKGFTAPGSEVQELFLPRTQLNIAANLTDDLSVNGQYFLEFEGNRFPEGGTFLSPTDFAYNGPDTAFLGALPAAAVGLPAAAGYVPFEVSRGPAERPSGTHANYGLKAKWSPSWARGDLGFYYRHFDEVQPWILVDFPSATSKGDFHLAYNENVSLYGFSYEHTFGEISTGLEVSYKHHMGLATTPSPAVPVETKGATGNIANVVANALIQLGSTPLYDTGNVVAEVAYTHLVSVDHDPSEAMFNAVGYAGCLHGGAPSTDKWDGCSTKNAVALAFVFDPQWLQVFPGIDLDMPISDTMGLYGNAAITAGGFYGQANHIYSGGLKATYRTNSSVQIQYNGSYGRPNGVTTTPAGAPVYASGNGLFQANDRGWVSLTFKTSF